MCVCVHSSPDVYTQDTVRVHRMGVYEWLHGLLIVDTTPPSVQAAIFHTKERFEEKKEESRKKKQILKCALKNSRLEAPLFPPFFPGSFLCSHRKGTEWLWGSMGGGYWIDLNAFTDFLSPHHGEHLTFEGEKSGREGETEIKKEG